MGVDMNFFSLFTHEYHCTSDNALKLRLISVYAPGLSVVDVLPICRNFYKQ